MPTRRDLILAGLALAACSDESARQKPVLPQTEGKIAVPGGNVVWRAFGNGAKTPLLLLHGGPGFSGDYLEPLSALGDERRVYLYDQLGSGRSDRPKNPSLWTRERYVEEVVAVRAALKLDQMHLFGHSWGTMLAAEYIFTKSPAGLRSVTFSGPCLSVTRYVADVRKLIAALPADARMAFAEAERTGNYESESFQQAYSVFLAKHMTRRGMGTPQFEKAMKELNLEVYGTMWGPAETAGTGNLKDFERADDLVNLKAPSFFVSGEFDECTPEAARWHASLAPGAEVAVIPGAAHLTTIDAPEATVALVRRFLNRVEA